MFAIYWQQTCSATFPIILPPALQLIVDKSLDTMVFPELRHEKSIMTLYGRDSDDNSEYDVIDTGSKVVNTDWSDMFISLATTKWK